jgi:hypothetical protein
MLRGESPLQADAFERTFSMACPAATDVMPDHHRCTLGDAAGNMNE